MKSICMLLTAVFLSSCGGADTVQMHVKQGDPTLRTGGPVNKEKAPVIVNKFTQLGITVQCPTDCATDYADDLQLLDDNFSNFQKETGRFQLIAFSDSDIIFDAHNKTANFPIKVTALQLADFFNAQANVQWAERTINPQSRIHLSFPMDKFDLATIKPTLDVVRANALSLRSLIAKIQWIEFTPGGNDCKNGVWSVDRSKFASQFGQALQTCTKGTP